MAGLLLGSEISNLSKHRIDRNEWPNELGYGGNIFGLKATTVSFNLCRFHFADTEELTIFPNPSVGVVGADPARIGPRMNRQQIIGHGRGDVHRTAVHAHDKARGP